MSYYSSHRLRLAIRTLRQGGVIAYPTEAVYGLGCDPWNAAAVQRLLALKNRSVRKGLIVIAAEIAQLTPFLRQLADAQDAEMLASWPGPHTWLLPVRATTPRWLTGDFETLAVRVTAHPLAAALCRHYGGAIVSTSANRAQRRPARTALQLRRALGQQPDYCLIGQCGSSRQPSTIRDGRSGQLVRGA
ncbi:tRNA threonylcarbamoyladenosine biosynthesis protein RimN [Chromatium okenii]|uniref:L-threonylcarbamoyladenylate synthase n=1 Tax=Chromatium okenii TaxID=61644 RepID=UPI001904C44B|nr:Sua5/YciO/YrdC/YwlC family protein [Chromatium okenii]MBK1641288.1 tRNA threonylcarbamoyladenosine biosynthesis protein RimN [Chromatium okenii]